MIEIHRRTSETDVRVRLGLNAREPRAEITTTEPFLKHMLETLARYAGANLQIDASGDLDHHLVEDVAITIGLACLEAIPGTCVRYAEATMPMDDALVQVVLDVGGRHYYEGPLPDPRWDHFARSLAENARWTLHVCVLRGIDRHHIVEAAIKAIGLALRRAAAEGDVVFSTKGAVAIERRTLADE